MGLARRPYAASSDAVEVVNAAGRGRFVIVCDHASNFLPAEFGSLGLAETELTRHIAWDPGALPVAQEMARLLDAPLVASRMSRLLIDCNRPLDAPDLIAAISETTEIPGNAGLSDDQRRQRVALAHAPFHGAIDALLDAREADGIDSRVVSIHSFTPVYRGVQRPWQIGIIHDSDNRLAAPLIAALQAEAGLSVGENEPYSPADRVYYTIERHARSRGLACAMIELRNDEIGDEAGQRKWAEMLADMLSISEPAEGKLLPAQNVTATEDRRELSNQR